MLSKNEILDTLAETLRQGRTLRVPVQGLSMGRTFARADEVVIRPWSPGRRPLGAIVVFRRSPQWVAHRVLWRFRTGAEWIYITRGDGERVVDQPYVRESECVGIVSEVCRKGQMLDLDSWRWRLAGGWAVALGWLCLLLVVLCKPILRR